MPEEPFCALQLTRSAGVEAITGSPSGKTAHPERLRAELVVDGISGSLRGVVDEIENILWASARRPVALSDTTIESAMSNLISSTPQRTALRRLSRSCSTRSYISPGRGPPSSAAVSIAKER